MHLTDPEVDREKRGDHEDVETGEVHGLALPVGYARILRPPVVMLPNGGNVFRSSAGSTSHIDPALVPEERPFNRRQDSVVGGGESGDGVGSGRRTRRMVSRLAIS